MSTRHEGLVPGQAAVLNLGSFERPRELVVASPVAMRVNLEDRSRTYTGFPGSAMGVFAYLKQLYYDAGHHRDAWAAYEESSRGRRRLVGVPVAGRRGPVQAHQGGHVNRGEQIGRGGEGAHHVGPARRREQGRPALVELAPDGLEGPVPLGSPSPR